MSACSASRAAVEGAPDGEIHDAIRDRLLRAGASFWPDLVAAAGTADEAVVLTALWDLVWAGEVTNDTFGPLRVAAPDRRAPRVGARPAATGPAVAPRSARGRGPLVARRAAARARAVADRARARGRAATPRTPGRRHARSRARRRCRGGFAGVYPVLRALEEAGRARRGWFVAGLGAAQFALPGAVDRLRAHRTIDEESRARVLVLAATDPAQPYGAALVVAGTSGASARPSRSAGAFVVLVDGECAAYLERGGKGLLTFAARRRRVVWAEALVEAHKEGRLAALQIERIDDEPARTRPTRAALRAAGFADGYKGLTLR